MARAPAVQDIEAVPEADRLEDFPHPRDTATVFGHAAAEQALADAIRASRMHHGWLLTGPEGIGKATLAYRLARCLLARAEERRVDTGSLAIAPNSTAARQVCALSHPGLLVIRRQWDHKAKRLGASIAVDEVRRLRNFLAHTMEGDSWRVVVVDPADDLNISAANAVLKSLEEPPARTVFLLISSEPGRLLATIRSRCRTLALDTLGDDDLRRAVEQAMAAAMRVAIPTEAWPRIAELAGGSVRRALSLAAPEGLVIHDKVAALIALLPKVDWPAAHELSDALSGASAEQRYEAFFTTLLGALADLIRVRAGSTGRETARAHAVRLIPDGRLADFAESWQRIAADKVETDRLNLDKKALVLNTLAQLSTVAARGRA